jgi:hypothetical protein
MFFTIFLFGIKKKLTLHKYFKKMKTKITLLLACLALFSCKKEADPAAVAEAPKPKTFDIKVDLIIPSDDELIFYYKDGTNEWFVEEKAVWAGVKGSANVQTVTFNLPEGVLPNDLRFDIGRNEFKNLKSLEIKKITLSYLDKNFDILQDQVNTFFSANSYISYDEASKQYTFKQDEKGNYDPYFDTKPAFYPELAKIAVK